MSKSAKLLSPAHPAHSIHRQKVGKALENNITGPLENPTLTAERAALQAQADKVAGTMAREQGKARKGHKGTGEVIAPLPLTNAYGPQPAQCAKPKLVGHARGAKHTPAKARNAAKAMPNVSPALEREPVDTPVESTTATMATLETERAARKAARKAFEAKIKAHKAIAARGNWIKPDGTTATDVSVRANRPSMPSMAKAQEHKGYTLFNYKRLASHGQPTVVWHTNTEARIKDRNGMTIETFHNGPTEHVEQLDYSAQATGRMNTRKGLTPQGRTERLARQAQRYQDGNALADEIFGKV
jgi:hypothetical protein